MDDWQTTALGSRHFHGRGQSKKGKGGKGSTVFSPQKSLGSYSLKCPAASQGDSNGSEKPSLDIFQFSDEGDGLVGTLLLPGLVQATIALAGSRTELATVAKSLGYGSAAMAEQERGDIAQRINLDKKSDEGEEHVNNEEKDDNDNDVDVDENELSDEEVEESDDENDNRFEKNSFRQPKFWMQWQGHLLEDGTDTEVVNGSGYVVFTGNDCKKFTGTLSCEKLDWKNIKMTGWKTAWKSERNLAISWE